MPHCLVHMFFFTCLLFVSSKTNRCKINACWSHIPHLFTSFKAFETAFYRENARKTCEIYMYISENAHFLYVHDDEGKVRHTYIKRTAPNKLSCPTFSQIVLRQVNNYTYILCFIIYKKMPTKVKPVDVSRDQEKELVELVTYALMSSDWPSGSFKSTQFLLEKKNMRRT